MQNAQIKHIFVEKTLYNLSSASLKIKLHLKIIFSLLVFLFHRANPCVSGMFFSVDSSLTGLLCPKQYHTHKSKACDGISLLKLMSSGHLRLNTLHKHCVCFVSKAPTAKPISSSRHECLKDLKAVNNSKPSLTRFTPGALCNLSGMPCASSNACIMLKCKSVSCQRSGRDSVKKDSLKGLANVLIGAQQNKQYFVSC